MLLRPTTWVTSPPLVLVLISIIMSRAQAISTLFKSTFDKKLRLSLAGIRSLYVTSSTTQKSANSQKQVFFSIYPENYLQKKITEKIGSWFSYLVCIIKYAAVTLLVDRTIFFISIPALLF